MCNDEDLAKALAEDYNSISPDDNICEGYTCNIIIAVAIVVFVVSIVTFLIH